MVHACHTSGLGPWDQVSCYCERAFDASFWAEPLNAISNIAFFAAALMAYTDLRVRRPAGGKGVILLVLLMMAVGAGSFVFHTFATKWAMLADVIPIGLFTFAYMFLALHRLLELNRIAALGVAAAITAAGQVMPPWFNGSFGYAPALLSMAVVGMLLAAREHPAARWVLTAGGVFAVSLFLRTIDGGAGCLSYPAGAANPAFVIGTHPLWHILNAVTLYLLLRALIDRYAGYAPKQ